MMKYSDEQILRFLEGDLPEEEREEIAKWLTEDQKGQKRLEEFESLLDSMSSSIQFEPSQSMDWEIRTFIESENQKVREGWTNWMRIAAAIALLVVGFSAGTVFTSTSDGDYVSLQNQVSDLQQLVMSGVLQDHSASERLQVVNQIEELPETPNVLLVNTLVETMSTDDSPNVRYAAVQALGKFMHLESVRMEMVRALEHQTDPLIQIAMINLLVEAQERMAIAPMKKLLEEDAIVEEVKRQAQIAIDILI